jgi:uncharacterized protein
MKQPRFRVYQDKAGAWRWHLKAANGRILAQGEAHTRKADAERAVATVKAATERAI